MSSATSDVLLVFCGSLLLRCLLSAHPHSGQGRPPMFGDYEAQRHWQEVTLHLPPAEWYRNGTDNDLQYWGLDYPPLTAYHSYAVGLAAGAVDPEFVALHSSRGQEGPEHKVLMRMSVLAVDAAVYLPAALAFAVAANPKSKQRSGIAFALLALYPGLILIDNGHFQYNNASLGLFLLAVTAFLRGPGLRQDLLGAFLFTCALNYKQMELYHALPVFFCLLGSALRDQKSYLSSIAKIAALGFVVLGTTAALWAPFLGSLESAAQVVHRIFPLARGVFEDKVSNFWCTLNLVVKIKQVVPDQGKMVLLCLSSTLAASLPSCLHLLLRPDRRRNLPLCLASTSLAFFLFSFQVHEKSILLAAVPAVMVAATVEDHSLCPAACVWFLLVSVFSMTPLLVKDGLAGAALALSVFFLVGCSRLGLLLPTLVPSTSAAASSPTGRKKVQPITRYPSSYSSAFSCLMSLSLLGCAGLGSLCALAPSPFPGRWPDLWPVLVSAYACLHFAAFLAYLNYVQLFCGAASAAYQGGGAAAAATSWRKKRN